jgi:antitoxin CcdA
MSTPTRRPTNLSIDAEVLDKARTMRINVSRAAEEGVRRAISREEAKQFTVENAEFIRSWNDYVKRNGLPLRKYRTF